MSCSVTSVCSYDISDSTFNDSVAEVKGGAVYYDLYRPIFNNNTFSNNSAQYGHNIASYPIKIKLKDTSTDQIILQNVVSGSVYSPALEFELVDHDEQAILTDSVSTLLIRSINANTSIGGTNVVAVNQGAASFDDLIFISKPGSNNVNFEVSSKAIDKDIVSLQYNGTQNQEHLDTSFRFCESGEVELNNQ